jgi:hypothetical protein
MDQLPLNRLRCIGCSFFRPIIAYPFSTSGFRKSTCESCNLRQTNRRNEEQLQLQEELQLYNDTGPGAGPDARPDAGPDAELDARPDAGPGIRPGTRLDAGPDATLGNDARTGLDIGTGSNATSSSDNRKEEHRKRCIERIENRERAWKEAKEARHRESVRRIAQWKAYTLTNRKALQELQLQNRPIIQGVQICTRCLCSQELALFGRYLTCLLYRVSLFPSYLYYFLRS